MQLSRRPSRKWMLAVFAVVLVAIIAMPICQSYYSTKTYTVTVTDKTVKHSETTGTAKYFVITELENGETRVFSIEDSFFEFRWNSSDVYDDIEIGKTYNIEVIGWRIPFLSQYENIMTFSPAE